MGGRGGGRRAVPCSAVPRSAPRTFGRFQTSCSGPPPHAFILILVPPTVTVTLTDFSPARWPFARRAAASPLPARTKPAGRSCPPPEPHRASPAPPPPPAAGRAAQRDASSLPSGKPLFSKCELPIEASGPRKGNRSGLGRSATAALPGEAGAAAAYGGRSVGAPELRRLDARPRACPPRARPPADRRRAHAHSRPPGFGERPPLAADTAAAAGGASAPRSRGARREGGVEENGAGAAGRLRRSGRAPGTSLIIAVAFKLSQS